MGFRVGDNYHLYAIARGGEDSGIYLEPINKKTTPDGKPSGVSDFPGKVRPRPRMGPGAQEV